MARKRKQTLVDKVARDLAAAIFRGDYAPGVRLPPLRTLAEQYDTTVPTTQRAIARVEQMGLLHVVQGSGMLVLDPKTHAGLAAIPFWIEAILSEPDAACEVLGDFLELRRQLAGELVVRARQHWSAHAQESVMAAVDRLEEATDAGRMADIVAADVGVFRAVLRVRPQLAYATVFNALERVMLEVPEVVEAMYADPDANVQGLRAFSLLLGSDESDDDVREIVVGMLGTFDRETIARFRASLT